MPDIVGLKSRDLITVPLGIPDIKVLSVNLDERGDVIITVESTKACTHCKYCGRKITKFHGHDRWIKLRHLPILGRRTYIRLQPKRYECDSCGGKTTTQRLDWYETKSPHTKAYDEHLMLQLVNSTVEDVSRKEDVGYDAVEGASARCIRVQVNWDEFDELATIGIDEIALTKGRQNFVAIITTQQADGHVALLAILPDRKKETVRQFLETIPKRLWPTMKRVCTDMWDGYVNAVEEFTEAHPEVSVEIVIDRFHVAKNYRDCVDKVRKRECRRLKKELPEEEYDEIKGAMWILRKNNKDLTPDERKKLNRLLDYSPELKLAYTLREELTAIFEMQLTREEAKRRLVKWRDKVKTIKRRCYGIPRVATLFQRLYLDLEGYRRFA